MLNLLDVYDDKQVLSCIDVDVVDGVNKFLMTDAHEMGVDVLDEVTAGLIPMDEMMLTEVGVNDVDNDVSPLNAMRPAGSTS